MVATQRNTAPRITSSRITSPHGWRAFRARSRYFQAKVLALVVWGVASLATLVYVAAPRHISRNALSARVTVLPGDPVMGRYFIVENESRKDWVGVRFEIDGGFELRKDAVLSGEKVTLYLRAFTRPSSRGSSERVAPALSHPVTHLRIESQGRTTMHWLSP